MQNRKPQRIVLQSSPLQYNPEIAYLPLLHDAGESSPDFDSLQIYTCPCLCPASCNHAVAAGDHRDAAKPMPWWELQWQRRAEHAFAMGTTLEAVPPATMRPVLDPLVPEALLDLQSEQMQPMKAGLGFLAAGSVWQGAVAETALAAAGTDSAALLAHAEPPALMGARMCTQPKPADPRPSVLQQHIVLSPADPFHDDWPHW